MLQITLFWPCNYTKSLIGCRQHLAFLFYLYIKGNDSTFFLTMFVASIGQQSIYHKHCMNKSSSALKFNSDCTVPWAVCKEGLKLFWLGEQWGARAHTVMVREKHICQNTDRAFQRKTKQSDSCCLWCGWRGKCYQASGHLYSTKIKPPLWYWKGQVHAIVSCCWIVQQSTEYSILCYTIIWIKCTQTSCDWQHFIF